MVRNSLKYYPGLWNKSVEKSLDDFLDMMVVVGKNENPKTLYPELIDFLTKNKNLDVDNAIAKIDDLLDDAPEAFKTKFGDQLDLFPGGEMGATRRKIIKDKVLQNVYGISDEKLRIKLLKSYANDVRLKRRGLKKYVKSLTGNAGDYYVLSMKKQPGEYMIFSKDKLDGELLVELKKKGFTVEDGAKFYPKRGYVKRWLFGDETVMVRNPNLRALTRTLLVSLTAQEIADIIYCANVYASDEFKRIKSGVMDDYKELRNQMVDGTVDEKEALRELKTMTEPINFEDCYAPYISEYLLGGGVTLDPEAQAIFSGWKSLPLVGPIGVAFTSIFGDPDMNRVVEDVTSTATQFIKKQVKDELGSMSLKSILEYECDYTSDDTTSIMGNITKDSTKLDIIRVLEIAGVNTQPIINDVADVIIKGNEKINIVQKDLDKMQNQINIEVSGIPDEFKNNLNTVSMTSLFNKACQIARGQVISKKINQISKFKSTNIEKVEGILGLALPATIENPKDKLEELALPFCKDDYIGNTPSELKPENINSSLEKGAILFKYLNNITRSGDKNKKKYATEVSNWEKWFQEQINENYDELKIEKMFESYVNLLCKKQKEEQLKDVIEDIKTQTSKGELRVTVDPSVRDYMWQNSSNLCLDAQNIMLIMLWGQGNEEFRKITDDEELEGELYKWTDDGKTPIFKISEDIIDALGKEYWCKGKPGGEIIFNKEKNQQDCRKDLVNTFKKLDCWNTFYGLGE